MRNIMLIFHFLGLAMGVGTSIGFIFLGRAGSKIPPEDRLKFFLNVTALSKMGYIGLILLVLSGGYLLTPHLENLANMPLFIAKLALVVVLIILVVIAGMNVSKAKKGDAMLYLGRNRRLGPVTLLVAITIMVLAVYTFH